MPFQGKILKSLINHYKNYCSSKIRTSFITISYSDVISLVSNSASRVFNERIDGQEIPDNIGKKTCCKLLTQLTWFSLGANRIFTMDDLKNLEWNCRGFKKQNSWIFIVSGENNNIGIVCLNKVQKWQKRFVFEKNLSFQRSNQFYLEKTITDRHKS